ncbi:hypothetical protein ACSNN7_24660, partial [Micromonospora sp. URMC 105]
MAGLTGVVGLAALGGLAARDDKADDPQRAGDSQAAQKQNVSDAGPAAGQESGKRGKDDNRDRDFGGRGEDRDRDRDRDRDEHGRVWEVPCDDEKLIEAVDLANRDDGGTLKLAPHCTYELDGYDRKSGTGLPTIRQEITIKGKDSTIKRDSEQTFRLFRVADGGDLTLKDVTLKGGNASEFKYDNDKNNGKDKDDKDHNGNGNGGPGQPGAGQPRAGGVHRSVIIAPFGKSARDGSKGGDSKGREDSEGRDSQRKDGDADGGALLVERGGSAHLKKV